MSIEHECIRCNNFPCDKINRGDTRHCNDYSAKRDTVIPVLPARTKVSVGVIRTQAGVEITQAYHYYCLDCSYDTGDVNEMLKHQKHPNITHKVKHLLKEMVGK